MFENHSGSRLVLIFAVQVITGTALFALVAALAIGLNLTGHWLKAHAGIDELVLTILKAVEVVILCLDATLFLIYLLGEAIKLARDIYKLVRASW